MKPGEAIFIVPIIWVFIHFVQIYSSICHAKGKKIAGINQLLRIRWGCPVRQVKGQQIKRNAIANKQIVPVVSEYQVGPAAAFDQVAAQLAIQAIASRFATQGIVAVAPKDGIRPKSRTQPV